MHNEIICNRWKMAAHEFGPCQHKIPNSWVACMKAWVGEPDWVCSGCSDQTVLTVAGHGLYVGSGWFDARLVEEVEEVGRGGKRWKRWKRSHSPLVTQPSLSLCSIEIGTFWDLKRYRSWNLLGDIFSGRCSSLTLKKTWVLG